MKTFNCLFTIHKLWKYLFAMNYENELWKYLFAIHELWKQENICFTWIMKTLKCLFAIHELWKCPFETHELWKN